MWKWLYDDGKLKVKTHYDKGNIVSNETYGKDGKITSRSTYYPGTSIAEIENYHENGNILSSGSTIHNTYFGTWKYYNDKGDLLSVEKHGTDEMNKEIETYLRGNNISK